MKLRNTKLVNSTKGQYLFIGFYDAETIGNRLRILEKLHEWDLRNDTIYISYSHIIEQEFVQIF